MERNGLPYQPLNVGLVVFFIVTTFSLAVAHNSCRSSNYCAGCNEATGHCTQCPPCYGKHPEGCKDDCVCQKCGENCVKCEWARSNCTKCNVSYGIDSTSPSNCKPCMISNCLACTANVAQCTSCKPGYTFNTEGACVACADNCLSCDIAGVGKCDKCKGGFGKKDDVPCGCLVENCRTCSKSVAKKCDVCSDGYELSTNGFGCDRLA